MIFEVVISTPTEIEEMPSAPPFINFIGEVTTLEICKFYFYLRLYFRDNTILLQIPCKIQKPYPARKWKNLISNFSLLL